VFSAVRKYHIKRGFERVVPLKIGGPKREFMTHADNPDFRTTEKPSVGGRQLLDERQLLDGTLLVRGWWKASSKDL
jgi:hypothetical protein